MNDELKGNKNATGFFKVVVDGVEIKQDKISFEVTENVGLLVHEGLGGSMQPKTGLQFDFLGNDLSGEYDVIRLLKVDFYEYEAMYSYRYKAKSGKINVELMQSPQRIVGSFEMVVEIYEESPPGGRPRERNVSGAFDLTNG
jgi:hypothetical protein